MFTAVMVASDPVCEVVELVIEGREAILMCRMVYDWQARDRQFTHPPGVQFTEMGRSAWNHRNNHCRSRCFPWNIGDEYDDTGHVNSAIQLHTTTSHLEAIRSICMITSTLSIQCHGRVLQNLGPCLVSSIYHC